MSIFGFGSFGGWGGFGSPGSAITSAAQVQNLAQHATSPAQTEKRLKSLHGPGGPVAGRDFFAGRGRSMQPVDWEQALAVARGLRRSARFSGYLYDPDDPEQEKRERFASDRRRVRSQRRRDTYTVMTGEQRRSKLTPGGVMLGGEPTKRVVG